VNRKAVSAIVILLLVICAGLLAQAPPRPSRSEELYQQIIGELTIELNLRNQYILVLQAEIDKLKAEAPKKP